MNPTRLLAALVLLVLVLGVLSAPAAPARADEAESLRQTVVVLCEAWRVDSPALLAEIEAVTERRPDAAENVRALLMGDDSTATRLVRLLAPAKHGGTLTFDDLHRVPTTVRSGNPGGAATGGFGGFLEVGARLQVRYHAQPDGGAQLDLQLGIQGAGDPAPRSNVPPSQTSTKLQASVAAPLGALRMFTSNTRGAETVLVFVRATALGDAPAPAVVDATTDFSQAEKDRFRALGRIVAEEDARARDERAVLRQLDRLGLELTAEQRGKVVVETLAYREAQRELFRERSAGGREEMQAAVQALQARYAETLQSLLGEALGEEAVDGLVEALMRGGGRRRFAGGGPGGR